jgi:ABC-2 type transport system ATP-binding protein
MVMSSGKAILEVESVQQKFRSGFWMTQVQVLHDVSLKVPEKSIYGFLGANGAGKTTLINLIVGLRRPTGGEIRVHGHLAMSPEARAKMGYLPERPYFYEHLTGEQFLTYFGRLSGMSRPTIQARIPQVLSKVGMTPARKVELRKYSKGMLQRIGVAQAILHEPEFLVLDEPMSGLDPIGRKEMRELIQGLAGEGRTIFFSTHVIPDVEAICDQVALIQKGRIRGSGPIQNFLSQGTGETEIAFAGKSKTDAAALGLFSSIREIPDGLRVQLPSQKVNEAVSRLLSSNATLMWVNPIRPSLESFFETAEERNSVEVTHE